METTEKGIVSQEIQKSIVSKVVGLVAIILSAIVRVAAGLVDGLFRLVKNRWARRLAVGLLGAALFFVILSGFGLKDAHDRSGQTLKAINSTELSVGQAAKAKVLEYTPKFLGGGPNEAAKYRWTKRAENYGRKIGPAVRAYAERVYEITNTIPLFR